MKARRLFDWKTFVIGLALAFTLVPAFTSATASAANCNPATDKQCVDVCGSKGSKCNKFITTYINPAIRVLTALVGIAAVLSIIFAGIQYSASADDPGMVTQAKERIFAVVLGLVGYAFLLAFFNWLVPGGIW